MKTEVPPTHLQTSSEHLQVIAWRRNQLLAAGFDPPLADELACSASVDLHALVELVERGCPPALAARILAPLEADRRLC